MSLRGDYPHDERSLELRSAPPTNLALSQAGGANAPLTVTLAGVPGQRYYITYLMISRVATAALAGNALLTIATTNFPGPSLGWRVGNAMAAGGTSVDVLLQPSSPIRTKDAGVNTTIVLPAPGAGVHWNVTVCGYAVSG